MASLSFQDSDIRKLNPGNIPSVFMMWYHAQTQTRKEEIRKLNPRLAAAMEGEILSKEKDTADDVPAAVPSNVSVSPARAADSVLGNETEDPVLDLWESVPLRNWREKNVEVPVLVCKIMPDGNRVCRFHSPRVPLEERFLKMRTDGGALYGARGFYCPECLDFYMEQSDFDSIISRIAEAGIAGRVQPLDVTLDEWRRDGVPNEWNADNPIYYTTNARNGQEMPCPIHREVLLRPDDYRIRYKDREVLFQAFYCGECGKLIMGKAGAGQLEDECAERGIPSPDFYPLRKPRKKKVSSAQKVVAKPDETVLDGHREPYHGTTSWEVLGEEDTIVIAYAAVCPEWDHEDQSSEVWRVVRVMEKEGGSKRVLVPLCYCGECERFYGAQENLKALLSTGRPEVNLLDETDSTSWITSGDIYRAENNHLRKIESGLDAETAKIQSAPGYTGQYAVNRYGYDDGTLAFAKHRSRTDYKKIEDLNRWKPNPYGYRVDLALGDKKWAFYLGNADIYINGKRKVMSYYTSPGREMVNVRTKEITIKGNTYQMKMLRRFDIKRALLFGYMDEWDESSAFSEEIRDKFLVRVLNMRRRQHKLLDIISTIQEKQNEIIDLPLKQNLIVQGCAGSGKTMVMLHRLSALQALKNTAFHPESSLIITPSQYFNLHIDGLAESLQIQYITRRSVEKYYAAVLETYDASFKFRGETADEMEDDQTWVDTLYSERFFRVLTEETDTAMREFQEYLESVLPQPPAVPNTARGAQLLPVLRDAVNRNAQDAERRENTYNQWAEEYKRLRRRLSELDSNIPKLAQETGQTVMAEASKARERLEAEMTQRAERIQELTGMTTDAEAEIHRLEKALFTLNRAKKIRALREQMDAYTAEMEECRNTLEKLAAAPDFMAAAPDELPSQLEQIAAYIPEMRAHSQSLVRRMAREMQARRERDALEIQVEKTHVEMKRAASERYDGEVCRELENLREQIGGMTLRILLERTGALAAKKAGIPSPFRGKVRRYSLYLLLRCALFYFGKPEKKYTLICIDEGQDLAQNEYRLIRDLNGPGVVFNIYGDTRQLLKTGRGIQDWNMVSEFISSPRVYTLNENYRNTNQITDYCNRAFHMQMTETGMDGTPVKEMHRDDLEEALSNLKTAGERTAVIVPRTVKKDRYLHMDAMPEPVRTAIGDSAGPGKIALVYVDEVKGVEFDRVFVIPNSLSENERYIAFTRALSQLTLVFDYALEQGENADGSDSTNPTEKNSQGMLERKKEPETMIFPLSANQSINFGKVRKRPQLLTKKRRA